MYTTAYLLLYSLIFPQHDLSTDKTQKVIFETLSNWCLPWLKMKRSENIKNSLSLLSVTFWYNFTSNISLNIHITSLPLHTLKASAHVEVTLLEKSKKQDDLTADIYCGMCSN